MKIKYKCNNPDCNHINEFEAEVLYDLFFDLTQEKDVEVETKHKCKKCKLDNHFTIETREHNDC